MTEGGIQNNDQTVTTVWVNGERDPGALPWVLLNYPAYLLSHSFRGVYFDIADFSPWWISFMGWMTNFPSRVVRKLAKSLRLVSDR